MNTTAKGQSPGPLTGSPGRPSNAPWLGVETQTCFENEKAPGRCPDSKSYCFTSKAGAGLTVRVAGKSGRVDRDVE
eukprot:353449-Heterocapsa_arctica.AAC.1